MFPFRVKLYRACGLLGKGLAFLHSLFVEKTQRRALGQKISLAMKPVAHGACEMCGTHRERRPRAILGAGLPAAASPAPRLILAPALAGSQESLLDRYLDRPGAIEGNP